MRVSLPLLSSLPFVIGTGTIASRQNPPTQYIIFNNCPTALPLYIAGDLVDDIPFQGNRTKFLTGDVPFINTNANGGSINSTGTLRAGFKASGGFYYFVKDPDRINTGIKIEPQNRPTVSSSPLALKYESDTFHKLTDSAFLSSARTSIARTLSPCRPMTRRIRPLMGQSRPHHLSTNVPSRTRPTLLRSVRGEIGRLDSSQVASRQVVPEFSDTVECLSVSCTHSTMRGLLLPLSIIALATLLLANPLKETRQTPPYASQFIVRNSCPGPIILYIGETLESRIQPGGNVTKFSAPGFFFTDAVGGNANGTGTTRAGFFDQGYYYIVRDGNGPLNTGMSVTPMYVTPHDGFCVPIECESRNCATAFSQPPTRFPPVNDAVAPTPPYYRCPVQNTTYAITFCPNGVWHGARQIHPNGHTEKCLDVRGGVLANGTPVQIYDCNGTPAQDWFLLYGTTKVRLAGTNFCLDAGSNPTSGVGMKIWECFDDLPAQQWYYTDDLRLAVEGQGQCLDLPNGVLVNSNQVQIWQCTDNNSNQIWTLE